MKIALCLSGHLRTYEKTYESIYEQLYQKYDVDTFISTWQNLGNNFAYHANFVEGADKTDPIVDVETIKKIYNPISIVMDDSDTEKTSNELKKQYQGIQTRNGAKMSQIMVMLYKIWDVNRLKREYEEKSNFRYDVVIRCRFDVYLKPVKIEIALDKIHATPGHMGVTDFVFVGPSSLMNDLCDIYTVMSPSIPFSMSENVEQLWATHLINNNIPFKASWDVFDYLRYAAVGIYDSKGNKVGDYKL